MLAFIRMNAVEILSIGMGVWLFWIAITYAKYFRILKTNAASKSQKNHKESTFQEARNKRKRTYDLAVTYPSYAIFWTAVIVWGISFLPNTTS